MRSFSIGLFVLWLTTGASAQPTPRAVTLQQAIEASSQAPEAQASTLRTRAADADVQAAGAWPASSLSVGTTRSTARFVVGATFPLPVFGTLGANIKVARAAGVEALREEAALRLELRRRVTAAWLDVAHAQERATLLTEAATREDALADFVNKRAEEGDAPHAETVLARAAAARVRAEANAAAASVAAASAALAGVLGWDPLLPLHAEGGLPAPTDTTPVGNPAAGIGAHPGVRLAAARVSSAGARVVEAKSAQWPELSIEGEADIDDPTLPGTDLRAMLVVGIPLFGGRSAGVRAASVRQDAARADLEATRRTAVAERVAAFRRRQASALTAHALAEQVVPAQRESVALVRSAYEEGAGSLATVLEAERTLAEVEIERVDALAEAALAQAELEAAMGVAK